MLSNNNIGSSSTGMLGTEILIDLSTFGLTTIAPTCIVIGCKNGHSNPMIKYYQVPDINQNDMIENSSSIARQWYINTLREDLYEYLVSKAKNGIGNYPNGIQPPPTPHFVCIEHFDEESFVLTNQTNQDQANHQQIVILKEDAVPSLFEIEVFQKMISHQEQIALNQQKQQQFNQTRPNTSFLSNLIFQQNDSNLINQQNQRPQNLISKSIGISNITTANNPGNKRVRMDPETRAALIQRVPKAVKRSTLLVTPQVQQQQQQQPSSPQIPRPQKALKHTMPREILPQHRLSTNSQSSLSPSRSCDSPLSNQPRMAKAVKHTSSNVLLKVLFIIRHLFKSRMLKYSI